MSHKELCPRGKQNYGSLRQIHNDSLIKTADLTPLRPELHTGAFKSAWKCTSPDTKSKYMAVFHLHMSFGRKQGLRDILHKVKTCLLMTFYFGHEIRHAVIGHSNTQQRC